jgi:hypothetical protein
MSFRAVYITWMPKKANFQPYIGVSKSVFSRAPRWLPLRLPTAAAYKTVWLRVTGLSVMLCVQKNAPGYILTLRITNIFWCFSIILIGNLHPCSIRFSLHNPWPWYLDNSLSDGIRGLGILLICGTWHRHVMNLLKRRALKIALLQ